MTNAAIVANFMEAKPELRYWEYDWDSAIPPKWWEGESSGAWHPRELTLDAIHEVEAKLTEMQPFEYLDRFADDRWALVHATAEEKLAALAAVLRGAK